MNKLARLAKCEMVVKNCAMAFSRILTWSWCHNNELRRLKRRGGGAIVWLTEASAQRALKENRAVCPELLKGQETGALLKSATATYWLSLLELQLSNFASCLARFAFIGVQKQCLHILVPLVR